MKATTFIPIRLAARRLIVSGLAIMCVLPVVTACTFASSQCDESDATCNPALAYFSFLYDGPPCELSSTWETVLSYQYAPGFLTSVGSVLAVSDRLIFASFSGTDSGSISHSVVQRSLDGGTTWAVVDDFLFSANSSFGGDLLISDGVLYHFFQAQDGTPLQNWVLRASIDGGNSWSTLNSFMYVAGQDAFARGAAVDVFGSFYWSGFSSDGSSNYAITRKSADGGATWTTVDEFQLFSGQDASLQEVIRGVDDNMYIAGGAFDGSSNFAVVRRTPDYGDSWETTESFQLSAAANALYRDVAASSSGEVYAAGQASNGSTNEWVVRKSTSSGFNMITIDQYQIVAGNNAEANAVYVDRAGDVYVGGQANDGTANQWVVRESSDGVTFSTSDTYQAVASSAASAEWIEKDHPGNLYVAGNANDGSVNRGEIRKRRCRL